MNFMLYYPHIRATYSHGGVRSGKSVGLCKIAQAIAYAYPGSDVLIARDTRVNLKNTTLRTFFGNDFNQRPIILPALYQLKNYNKTEGRLIWNNGSTTCFWGLDNPEDIEKVKSTEWSAVLVDEAPGIDVEVLKFVLETRLSHVVGPHKMMLTSNTDSGHSDIYRMFYRLHNLGLEKTKSGKKEKRCEECMGACEFRTIPSNTLENEANLPKDYTKRIKRLKYTNKRYYDIYVMGEFKEFTKKIFPEFQPDKHVVDIPANWQPPAGTTTVYGYDHGYSGAPSCLVECKILPDGTYLFWREFYWEDQHVKTMAQDMIDNDIHYVHAADPSINAKTQYKDAATEGGGSFSSVRDLFQKYHISMQNANNDVSGGIEKMKSLFLEDPDHDHPIIEGVKNCPYILIARRHGHNTCPNLTTQLMLYQNKMTARGEVHQTAWIPVKKDDHAVDPARYIINSAAGPGIITEKLPDENTIGYIQHVMRGKKLRQEDEISSAF